MRARVCVVAGLVLGSVTAGGCGASSGSVRLGSNPQVFIISAGGKGLRQLSHAGGGAQGAFWLLGSKRVGYVAGSNPQFIESQQIDGRDRTALSAKFPNAGAAFSASSDMTALEVVDEIRSSHTLEVLGPGGSRPRTLDTYFSNSAEDYSPAWSPNGHLIALGRPIGPAQGGLQTAQSRGAAAGDLPDHIYVVRPNGRDRRAVTTGPASDDVPLFSPDGRSILFLRTDGNVAASLCTVATRGGTVRRISPALLPGVIEAAWSPTGDQVAFVGIALRGDRRYYLYVLDVRTRKMTKLAGPVQLAAPTWSPNGREIAFAPYGSGQVAVAVVGAQGSDARDIATIPSSQTEDLAWSPDGAMIAFSASKAPSGD
jgi:WD40-like Beta Propeller Repeat